MIPILAVRTGQLGAPANSSQTFYSAAFDTMRPGCEVSLVI